MNWPVNLVAFEVNMKESTVFNNNNTAFRTGDYPLFLGQPLGTYDTKNRPYPKLFELYKQQKAQDWSEDEVPLHQSRIDFKTAPRSETDICLETLMWQWEADSRVSRNIFALLAPFITNNELGTAVLKQTEIEALHALTYSDIVFQCLEDGIAVMEKIKANHEVLRRSSLLDDIMEEVEKLGAMYRLGMEIDEEHLRQTLCKFMVCLLALEGIQFMSSFACTFALAERDLFMGVAQLVQKIMLDEILHSKIDFEIIRILREDPVWAESFRQCMGEIKIILDTVIETEEGWSDYIFSDGRAIVGLNSKLLKEWVYYCAKPMYDFLGIEFSFDVVTKNPLPLMDKWMEIDKQQNANQEQDNTQYLLNTLVDDAAEKIIKWDFFKYE